MDISHNNQFILLGDGDVGDVPRFLEELVGESQDLVHGASHQSASSAVQLNQGFGFVYGD